MKFPFPNIRTLKNEDSSPDILVRDFPRVYQYFHCSSCFRNALLPHVLGATIKLYFFKKNPHNDCLTTYKGKG